MPVYTNLYGAFFLAVCCAVFFISFVVKNNENRGKILRVLLLLASLAFYAYAGRLFVLLLFYEAVVTYLSGRIKTKSNAAFWVFALLQLVPLLALKTLDMSGMNVILPLGISFFSLQSFSYNYSVHFDEFEPEKDFITVFLFVAFFPTMSSGPIMRAKTLIPQFKDINGFDYDRCTDGLKLYCFGLFKKLVIGDNLAMLIQSIKAEAEGNTNIGCALFVCAILYSIQIYADFSGYSDIVTGCGKVLGFELTRNFDHPYMAKSVGEFWRRWHISLSSFLRDYIYIPLGGSRVALYRTFINTMIVFLISGFWHGNGMTFIVWGLMHGLIICIERAIKIGVPSYKGSRVLTFLLVTLAWIFFAAGDVSEALGTIASFGHIPYELGLLFGGQLNIYELLYLPCDSNIPVLILSTAAFLGVSIYTYGRDGLEEIRKKNVLIRWGAYYALMLCVLLFKASEAVNFIYNKF